MSVFGQPQQQHSGGLFGQQPQGSGLFGSSTATQPQSGGLFGSGAAQPATGGGLFGGQQQQSGGLFDQKPQPQQSGGLFGSSNQQQPQQGGGLFGQQQQQQQQSGGLFGQSTQTATGSLFAQPQQQSGGLFGASVQQPQQQQMGGSVFGQPQQLTGFGGSILGVSNMNQQQMQMQMQQQGSNAVVEKIQRVKNSWDPGHPEYAFRYYFFNHVGKERAAQFQKPANEDSTAWEKAWSERPHDSCVPVRANGFKELDLRVKVQEHQVQVFRTELYAIQEKTQRDPRPP